MSEINNQVYPSGIHCKRINAKMDCIVLRKRLSGQTLSNNFDFSMRIKFLISILLISHSFAMKAQERCGTMQWLKQLEAERPSIIQQREVLEQQTSRWIKENDSKSLRSVITIPVVVHVIYFKDEENISDDQIFSQIAILNEDYRRQNSDRTKTPAIFQDVAADCEIEFCLARQDPSGNPATGITRTRTQAQVFQMGNAMKRAVTGGNDAWDSNKYLNIWVCNLTQGLLGYGSIPGSDLSPFDGVVIGYKYFGKGGVTASPYNLGRTATHEVGHWLNLQHIWGDNDGADPCSGSDFVGDTPNQARQNEGCPDFPSSSCGNSSDMFMNYMDYTRDICMNIFTKGQKSRMLATLNGSRSSILTSAGCQEPVFKPECDTATNASSPDGLVYYRVEDVSDEGSGFLIGHNSFGYNAFAEKITSSGEKAVTRLLFDFAIADFETPQDSIKAFILAAGPEGPGAELAAVKISYADIAENINQFVFTEALFEPGITVNGDFYIGFEIDYLAGDSACIYSTQFDQSETSNSWFRDSTGKWHSYNDKYGIFTSMGIYTEICSKVSTMDNKTPAKPVLLFPNPADQYVSFHFDDNAGSWQIFSADGRLIRQGRAEGQQLNSIATKDLANGFYLFSIISGKNITTSRLIIQH